MISEERRREDFEVVSDIIRKGLGESNESPSRVFGDWVQTKIGDLIPPSQLFNWAIHAGVDCTDGPTNLDRGAKALFDEAMAWCPYMLEEDGWIRELTNEELIEQVIERGGVELLVEIFGPECLRAEARRRGLLPDHNWLKEGL